MARLKERQVKGEQGPTKQDLVDLFNSLDSLVNDYGWRTEAELEAVKVEKELEDYIETLEHVKKQRKLIATAAKAGRAERSKIKHLVNRFKHLVLAKGVCKETLAEADKLRLLYAKLAEKSGDREEDD